MNILICGNYGAGNLGDELILKGLIKMLRSIPGTQITVMSASPSETEKLHSIKSVPVLPTGIRSFLKSVFTLSTAKTWHAIKESDYILFGGGELFNENEPYSLYLWGTHVKAFQKMKKKYIIIGQSFSGLNSDWSKKVVENAVNGAEEVFVRDQESQDFLYLLDIKKKVHVTTDPAFILDQNDFELEEHDPAILVITRKYKGINLDDARMKIMEVAQELKQTTRLNIFDVDIGQIREPLDYYWNLFRSTERIFAMRLHAALLAILVEKPFLALSYSSKVENMMKKMGLEEVVVRFPLAVSDLQQKLHEPFPIEKIKQVKAQEREIAENQRKTLTGLLI